MQHARQWWEGLGSRHRLGLIVSSVGAVAALIVFLYVARTPAYIPLCANLSAAEAGSILSTLREAQIPFRVEEGGSRIDVPATVHDEALVRIARRSAPVQKPFAEAEQDKLQSLIDNTIGPHKAVVLVNAELSADKEETQTSTTGVATTVTEEMNGAAHQARDTSAGAGMDLIPPAGGRYVHATAVKTSQPGHTVRHIVRGPGRIERLAVSALIDTTVPPGQVTAIQQALEAAIAANPKEAHPTRTVSIAQAPFDHSAEESAARAALADNILSFVRIGVSLALLAGFLLLLARSLRRQTPLAFGTLGLDSEGAARAGLPVGSGGMRSVEVLDASFESDLEKLQYLSRSHPETVAMLLKNWIREEY